MVNGYYSYLAYYKYQRLEILAKKPYSKQEHLEQNVSCAKHINSAVDGKGWYYRKAAEAEECLFPVGRQLRDCLNGSTRNSILSQSTHCDCSRFSILLIRDMLVERCNRRFGCETIHPTQKFTSMNLFKMPCLITQS